jgi:Acyl-protein synthetase, LuxE
MIGVFGIEISDLKERIFSDDLDFEKTVLTIFRFQSQYNEVYKSYLQQLKINADDVKSMEQIPFLPIQFFKTKKVITQPLNNKPQTSNLKPQTIFQSSGTTSSETSKHYVIDFELYKKSFTNCFNRFYGKANDYCVLALLPSYLERNNSSLVFMCDELIKQSSHPHSGFYLDEIEKLKNVVSTLITQKQKFILLGVTFALLDFAEYYSEQNALSPTGGFGRHGLVMETGGMKGRRKEMVREEVHGILKKHFQVDRIRSEYGMTELLSQSYSNGNGIFYSPPWMKILIRDTNDPFKILGNNKTGGINVIDLANIYSCSFLATQDLGKTFANNSFEVLGRFDTSDLRGCNLMVE